jgi:hypothetical protein
MGYTVSALSNYTNEPEKVIYQKIFTGSPIIDAVKSAGNIQPGIKSAETINLISTSGVWQAQGCSLNPSGTSTFTQRTITVGKPKVDLSFCERDLEPKFTQKAMKAGGNYDSLTFEKEIMDDLLQGIAQRMGKAIWQGDTTSVDQYLLHFDGLVKIINAASIGGTYSGTSWSSANSRTVIQGLNALVTANADVYTGGETQIKYYMSPAMAYAYRQKLINDNLFHIDANNPKQTLYAEGTTIEIVEDFGLVGLNYIYALEASNTYIGTDLENEQEKVDMWFSKDDQKIYTHVEWKAGVQVAFPTRIYKYLGV